ncbi:DUF1127 domain-containing protein [Phaeobacter sp. PT47_59]|uniref:DUF1127 domain-containing protein n=1 Tax=Phaeobacter sp. PT47_59 TaxID=3029979 RepID=UPI002380420E|nr:DUF1127 domain-containing protein [Phaeobacter sp. PT47_59]MDE4174530.1 DUF1127 domain-containing protein [Phaeobacter sp. PT47_59]
MTQHAPTAHPNFTFLNTQPTLPVLAQVAVEVAVLVTKWSLRHRSRKQLRGLSQEQLQDIGLTRAEAHYEATLPFWRP